jgi:hypothetical protein
LCLEYGMKFVVTAKKNSDLTATATSAVQSGANYLEVRSDLPVVYTQSELTRLPVSLLYAVRPDSQVDVVLMDAAAIVDVDLMCLNIRDFEGYEPMISWHNPLISDEEDIVSRLSPLSSEYHAVKYVEPAAGDVNQQIQKLEQVRAALRPSFKAITILITGHDALKGRRLLASENDLYYCSLDEHSLAAPGQGLIATERAYFAMGKNDV